MNYTTLRAYHESIQESVCLLWPLYLFCHSLGFHRCSTEKFMLLNLCLALTSSNSAPRRLEASTPATLVMTKTSSELNTIAGSLLSDSSQYMVEVEERQHWESSSLCPQPICQLCCVVTAHLDRRAILLDHHARWKSAHPPWAIRTQFRPSCLINQLYQSLIR